MPRETWHAPLILPPASSSGASRTSRMSTSSRPAISRALAASSRGTVALAAASISFTLGIDSLQSVGTTLDAFQPNREVAGSSLALQRRPSLHGSQGRQDRPSPVIRCSYRMADTTTRRWGGGPHMYKPFAALAALAAIGCVAPASAQ